MKKHVLLLIEDNPLLTGMYKSAFEKQGVKVLMAHNGRDGLELAKEKLPEIILLDLLMPGIDGFEVLRELKKNPKTKNIKILILTVLADEGSKKKAADLGATNFLVKSDLELHEIVEQVSVYFKD